MRQRDGSTDKDLTTPVMSRVIEETDPRQHACYREDVWQARLFLGLAIAIMIVIGGLLVWLAITIHGLGR